jgi:alpha-mannosidase
VYSLLPHPGDFRQAGVIAQAYELNVPLRTRTTDAHAGVLPPACGLLRVDHPGVVIEAVKRPDQADGLVVRIYESWGGRAAVTIDASGWLVGQTLAGAVRTDLLERPLGDLGYSERTVSVDLRPFEIMTIALRRR